MMRLAGLWCAVVCLWQSVQGACEEQINFGTPSILSESENEDETNGPEELRCTPEQLDEYEELSNSISKLSRTIELKTVQLDWKASNLKPKKCCIGKKGRKQATLAGVVEALELELTEKVKRRKELSHCHWTMRNVLRAKDYCRQTVQNAIALARDFVLVVKAALMLVFFFFVCTFLGWGDNS